MLRRRLKQRPRGSVRHLPLEILIHIRLIFHVPARKKGGQRKLWKDHEIAAFLRGLLQQHDHPRHNGLTAIGLLDRTKLGSTYGNIAHHASIVSAPAEPKRTRGQASLSQTKGAGRLRPTRRGHPLIAGAHSATPLRLAWPNPTALSSALPRTFRSHHSPYRKR